MRDCVVNNVSQSFIGYIFTAIPSGMHLPMEGQITTILAKHLSVPRTSF